VIVAMGVLLSAFLVYLDLVAHPQPGWVSVMVLILVIGGFIITSTGVTGLYIGRVFQQVKGRPLYVIDSVVRKPPARHAVKEKPPRQEVESLH
jgi:dolichol-phosphate mannosyltransferase